MSRTYRRDMVYLDQDHKPMPIDKEEYRKIDEGREYYEINPHDYYSKWNSKVDRKPWHKSSSTFKKIIKKHRKAKVRQAMKRGDYNNLPRFRNENDWMWN